MKKFKKIMALILAVIMSMSMSMAAFAAPTNENLTVPNNEGHTYEIFQIFTGDLSEDRVLSNVKWGVNGPAQEVGNDVSAEILTELGKINSSESSADNTTIDSILSKLGLEKSGFTTANAYKKEVSAGSTVSVPTGYYLVKDKDNSLDEAETDAYTLLLINVVGPTTLTAKSDVPTVVKKVTDVNDSEGTSEVSQDSADYDIGDEVPFTLTATLAQNVSAYKKYHITFVDELEDGKFSAISALTIKLDDKEITNGDGYTVSTSGYNGDAAPTVNGFTQTIEFTPSGEGNVYLPSSLNGATVTIEFTATLGPNAAIGKAGNKNDVTLQYSNNPNDDQGGEEGTTPKDTVKVFTYKVSVDKIDPDKAGNDKSLVGANFTLYKKVIADKDGNYPTGAEIGETIKARFDASVKDEALNDDVYYIVAGTKTGDASGATFAFNGIDDGTYVLVETTIPAGYNAWDAVEFEVNAEHDEEDDDPQLTSLTGGALVPSDPVSGEINFKDTGIITTNIENRKGSVLPSTGGMGTTIFYVVGGFLALAAGVLLVVKRRMSVEN